MSDGAAVEHPNRIRRSPDREPPERAPSFLASSEGWATRLPLSPRECEIARLVARDLSNKEIAAVLEISGWTVATHLRRVFAKLGVHSKAAMVGSIVERLLADPPRPLYPRQ
jgi:DNA-binding CsgD family transcriptional regulator